MESQIIAFKILMWKHSIFVMLKSLLENALLTTQKALPIVQSYPQMANKMVSWQCFISSVLNI